ncbi:MAG: ribonuclease HI [Deltaproteobacteria bacterium]|nr:MAG: ribonuclease HI [Deltaproteobacteria bacterium]TMQ24331.1 MAG: ribonuclease HI [Deltaproteobacteria bacterium]
MPWLRHRLRDADVWARVDASAALVKDADGRVEIVYKPAGGARVYRAGARNLQPAPGSEPVEFEPGESAEPRPSEARPTGAPRRGAPAAAPADAIHVWTDGACSGNPGRAGLGVVIVGDGPGHREISEYLGEATNNIAELTAILRGLEAVTDRTRPVFVYSDSAYSIGLLTQSWKAKKNVELVEQLRALTRSFRDLHFVKVAAHSGISLNERVDQLAVGAISHRSSTDRRV